MRELSDAFVRQSQNEQVSVPKMMKTYRAVALIVEEIQRKTRARSFFEASVLQVYFAAGKAADIQQSS